MTSYQEINEVLNYGTDEQIRATLEAIAGEMFENDCKSYEEVCLELASAQSLLDEAA